MWFVYGILVVNCMLTNRIGWCVLTDSLGLQTEQGRLWFARCINAKRCCKCVTEASFFSLIQHFSVMLFECNEAEDFSPAKSLMNMCFTYYHEGGSHSGGVGDGCCGQRRQKGRRDVKCVWYYLLWYQGHTSESGGRKGNKEGILFFYIIAVLFVLSSPLLTLYLHSHNF